MPIPQKLYNITKRLKTPEQVEKYFPGFLSFIDCTEQQIPRPVDKNRRKTFYSGKKKKHGIKTQFMVNIHGLIIHKTDHNKGQRRGIMTMISIKIIVLLHQITLSMYLI